MTVVDRAGNQLYYSDQPGEQRRREANAVMEAEHHRGLTDAENSQLRRELSLVVDVHRRRTAGIPELDEACRWAEGKLAELPSEPNEGPHGGRHGRDGRPRRACTNGRDRTSGQAAWAGTRSRFGESVGRSGQRPRQRAATGSSDRSHGPHSTGRHAHGSRRSAHTRQFTPENANQPCSREHHPARPGATIRGSGPGTTRPDGAVPAGNERASMASPTGTAHVKPHSRRTDAPR